MAAKSTTQLLEDLFKDNKSSFLTYENIASIVGKLPTAVNAKKFPSWRKNIKLTCALLPKGRSYKT